MHTKFSEDKRAVNARRRERRGLIRHDSINHRDETLARVRRAEAERKQRDEPFQPRSDYELALTEWMIEEHKESQRLIVLDEAFSDYFQVLLETMRYNHVMGTRKVTPVEFRAATHELNGWLFQYAFAHYGVNPKDAAMLFMWRAALLGANAAHEEGIRAFFHIDANRKEGSARCSEPRYFEAPAAGASWSHVFALDIMCASGGSDDCSVVQLQNCGVAESKIIVLANISAPEGVDHILHNFPEVRLMTVALDERLNSTAYITGLGLGDAGDQGFAGFTPDDAVQWYEKGILSANGLVKLQARIRAAAQAA